MNAGLTRAVDRFGTKSALAQELGITRQALDQWDRVPVQRVLDVERLTGVPRTELRPDIYPPEK